MLAHHGQHLFTRLSTQSAPSWVRLRINRGGRSSAALPRDQVALLHVLHPDDDLATGMAGADVVHRNRDGGRPPHGAHP